MRAVDAIMECLKAEGVDAVFGIPGGANLPTYDALYDAGVRNILCRHEQGAGHAAEGYAKATGKVGVALAHLGPGRHQPRHPDRRRDAGLGADGLPDRPGADRSDRAPTASRRPTRSGITMPIVKHSFQVLDPREIPSMIHEAFHVARTGRPGPVLVDVPAGPVARGHSLRPLRGGEGRPPRLQELRRGQREADPPRRQGARQRQAAGHLRGRRRHQRRTPPRSCGSFVTHRTSSRSPAP